MKNLVKLHLELELLEKAQDALIELTDNNLSTPNTRGALEEIRSKITRKLDEIDTVIKNNYRYCDCGNAAPPPQLVAGFGG